MFVVGAILVTGIWVVSILVVWIVVVSVNSTIGSVMKVINQSSLLLKMVIIRVNITISVEETIVDGEHVGLEHILVFSQVLALMGEHVSVLQLEVMAQWSDNLWCIVMSSNFLTIDSGLRFGFEGLNVISIVAQSVVEWGILLEEGRALRVLNSGQGTLSVSKASSSGSTSAVSTWI